MARSIPVDYTQANALDEAANASFERLAASLPKGLVDKIAISLPEAADGSVLAEHFTGWGPRQVAAYLLAGDPETVLTFGGLEMRRADFPANVLAELDKFGRTDRWAAPEAADCRALAEDQVALSLTIGLVSTYAEDVHGAQLEGNPFHGKANLVFETDDSAEAFLADISTVEDEAARTRLVSMGIPLRDVGHGVAPSV